MFEELVVTVQSSVLAFCWYC